MGAQRLDQRRLLRIRHDEISDEARIAARLGPRDDGAFPHAGVAREHGVDFVELDAEAADFHLLVDATQVLKIAVGQPPRAIAGAVKARTLFRLERVGHKALPRQVRAIEVARGHARAADENFPRLVAGDAAKQVVDEVNLEVGNRHADIAARVGLDVLARDAPVGDMHRRLGDAVHVDAPRLLVAVALEPRDEALELERLAAEDDGAQRERGLGLAGIGLHQLAEGGRCLIEHGDFFADEQLAKRLGRAAYFVRHDDERAAITERAEDFPDGKVERVGMEERPDIRGPEAKPSLRGGEEPRDVLVRDKNALRLAGGTGGVDDVGDVRRADRAARVLRAFAGERVFLHADDRAAEIAEPGRARGIGQHHFDGGILHHELEPILRAGEIERQVGTAGLQNSEDGDDHLERAIEIDGDQGIGCRTQLAQAGGQTVGGGVKFAVSP